MGSLNVRADPLAMFEYVWPFLLGCHDDDVYAPCSPLRYWGDVPLGWVEVPSRCVGVMTFCAWRDGRKVLLVLTLPRFVIGRRSSWHDKCVDGFP